MDMTIRGAFFLIVMFVGCSAQDCKRFKDYDESQQSIYCAPKCLKRGKTISGSKFYDMWSDVCTAALHDGRISPSGGDVYYITHRDYNEPLKSSLGDRVISEASINYRGKVYSFTSPKWLPEGYRKDTWASEVVLAYNTASKNSANNVEFWVSCISEGSKFPLKNANFYQWNFEEYTDMKISERTDERISLIRNQFDEDNLFLQCLGSTPLSDVNALIVSKEEGENVENGTFGVYTGDNQIIRIDDKRLQDLPTSYFEFISQKECPSGFYGPKCNGKCRCQNMGTCHPRTGSCICQPGFNGIKCQNKCPPDSFGSKCQLKCDRKTLGSGFADNVVSCEGIKFCLPKPYGCSCVAGYMGPLCQQICDRASCEGKTKTIANGAVIISPNIALAILLSILTTFSNI